MQNGRGWGVSGDGISSRQFFRGEGEGGREGGDLSLSPSLSLASFVYLCTVYSREERKGEGRRERESTASSVPPN